MKLYIENIGKISKSEFLLDGLTVLTGLNDNGKSTIGKSLFSLVKLLSPQFNVESDNTETRLLKIVSDWYDELGYSRFTNEVLKKMPQTPDELTYSLIEGKNKGMSLNEWLNPILFGAEELPPRLYSITKDVLKAISEIYQSNNDNKYKNLFSKIVISEFAGCITTYGKENSIIKFSKDSTKAELIGYDFELCIQNNKLKELIINGKSTCIEDVTYVDSPLYMHLFHILKDSKSKWGVPMHISDLTDKLNAQRYLTNANNNELDLSNVLGTKGYFTYQEESNGIVFVRDNNNFPVINVASGLKSFGVLQLLLNGGFISANKMLIWDEPENHIHPEWQLNFAEIIVQLVKSGIPILLTTHSPYFLQSLRYYAKKYEIEKYTNFYFSSKDESNNSLSSFINVNYSLNDVFVKLANPLNKVINLDLMEDEC